MKQNWDQIYPDFSHLLYKKVRNQASRIIKNKLATNSNTTLNFHSYNSDITDNECVNESINVANYTPTNIKESNVKNNQTQTVEYKTWKGELKSIFLEIIDSFNNKSVNERINPTKVNTKINNIFLKFVDDLSKEYLTSLISLLYRDINVCLYSAAITCLCKIYQ